MPYPELSANHGIITIRADDIRARALRSDYFHSGQLGQAGRYLVLHPNGEISVCAVRTEIFKRQNRDRALHFVGGLCLSVQQNSDSCGHDCKAKPCRGPDEPLPPCACLSVETHEAAMNCGK